MKKPILSILLILISIFMFSQKELEFNKKGIEFAKKGKLQKAFELFEKAIETNPNFPNAYSNRGNVYRMQEKYDLAIADYSKSFELNPKNLSVIYSRANVYLEINEFENSILDYSVIINQDPSFENIYFDRAYAYIRLKNYEKAKVDLESQIELNPKDFKSLANLIRIKTELGLIEEAIVDYEKIFKEFPNQSNSHILFNNRAHLYKDLGNYEKALMDINVALMLEKKYDIGYLSRAIINLKLDNENESCKDFKKAIKLGVEQNEHFEADEDYEKLKSKCK